MQHHSTNRPIALWLIACAATVFAMILLGGITRLTHSGLSMVEWKPLLGAIPPLNDTDWWVVFDKYRAFPEYQKLNAGMSLAEFKFIFYLEYFHRLLGRMIGLIFLLPLIYFWIRSRISKSLLPKLLALFVLGGLQGLLGWYMVKSGLIDEPRVSQYRLTAHLGAAVIIYAYMLWIAFGLLRQNSLPSSSGNRRLYHYSTAVTLLIFVMILSGGLVAGTHAGFAYNTFPLMAGKWIPDGLFALQPLWRNAFENIITVQFDHRLLACFVALSVFVLVALVFKWTKTSELRISALLLLLLLSLQISLGTATLLYIVPVTLASLHQAGAILLFTASLYLTRQLKPVHVN